MPRPYHVKLAAKPRDHAGLVLKEYFAGYGAITKGWQAEGGVARAPVELYEDPHHGRGVRPEHDLSSPAVQQRCLDEIEAEDANIEWMACPCFCDQNNGTRTFDNPSGSPNEKEAMGNCLADFQAGFGARPFSHCREFWSVWALSQDVKSSQLAAASPTPRCRLFGGGHVCLWIGPFGRYRQQPVLPPSHRLGVSPTPSLPAGVIQALPGHFRSPSTCPFERVAHQLQRHPVR